ncbi:MAG: DUF3106 domain-containing protein [Candidatus Angelobacter sp.]
MKRANQIVVYLATAFLGFAVPCSSLAQQKRQPPPPPPRAQVTAPHAERPRGHAGDFLRRYGDLPPDEQEQALQNDPEFRRLPVERQQKYRQRLQHFSNLPPDAQLKILNRMETWEHLTPEQKQEARQLFGQFRQLPPDRQRVVTTAIEGLRAMPPDQREQVINSERYKGTFSDQERELMRGAARLPLSPPSSEGGPQE